MNYQALDASMEASLPTRGAWIEILSCHASIRVPVMSLPTRGAWIEIIFQSVENILQLRSLPTRGAWIEITCFRFA